MSDIKETLFDIPVTSSRAAMDRVVNDGGGVIRFAPSWVPRAFCSPGRRLRLHPDDYYPFAKGRGGIDERWLGSAIRADNGPQTGPYEGLSLTVDPRAIALSVRGCGGVGFEVRHAERGDGAGTAQPR